MDLAIRGGSVVTLSGISEVDVGISDGRIVQLGGDVPTSGRELDARGKLVLPGCVDIHTHLAGEPQFPPLDDFSSGTRAAAAGGVTTVCDFAHQLDGEGLEPAIARVLPLAAASIVDYAFHIVLNDPNPQALHAIPDMARDGFAGLKVFMPTPRFAERTGDYLQALRIAAGASVLTAIHAEDYAIVAFRTRELLASGRTSVHFYADSRPAVAEELAVATAIAFSQITDAPIYLVHLSSSAALDRLRVGRSQGARVYGETRPMYLHLTRAVFDLPNNEGAKYVGEPPLREAADVDAIWHALRVGELATVCSDHLPHALAAKMDPAHTFDTIPPGVSNLETLLPMLYSEGVRNGRLSLQRMVEVVATNPARIAGLASRKGSIRVDADADVVIFDPDRTRTIRAAEMHSACDYDPFEGRVVTGWPSITVSRGEVIYTDGKVVASPGRGKLLPRATFADL